jgi:hypothetical protein
MDENELIESNAEKLIRNLGRRYSYENLEYGESDSPCYGEYFSTYGISIKATYTDNSYSEFDSLNITFNGRDVYSKSKGIMVYGKWMDILNSLTEKIPVFLREIGLNKMKNEHASNIYKNYVVPLCKRVSKINNSLVFSGYQEYDPYHAYGDSTTYHQTVIKDGVVVLDIIDNIYSFSVHTYKPGTWELELFEFYDKYMYNETEEESREAEKQLNRLNNLK